MKKIISFLSLIFVAGVLSAGPLRFPPTAGSGGSGPGDIEGVTAGTNMNGGGASGTVALNLDGEIELAGPGFSVGTSTLVVTGGKVGVGTTAPTATLEVNGDFLSNSVGVGATASSRALRVTNLFSDYAELTVAPTDYTYTALAGKALRVTSTDTVHDLLAGSTVPVASLLSSGGLGRTGLGISNPTVRLQMGGEVAPTFLITSTGATPVSLGFTATGSGQFSSVRTTTDHPMYLGANSTLHLGLLSNGHFGIGTVAPSYRLHVTTNTGSTATVFAVSTGTVDLFKVAGGSIVARVPIQAEAGVQGPPGSGGAITLNGRVVSTGPVSAVNIVGEYASFPAVQITTTVLTSGTTWFVGCAPSYSAITLRRSFGESFSVAASSINFSYQEKTSQGVNGSQVFTGTYSTVTWQGGIAVTSFADGAVAAGSCVYLVTKPAGAIAGTPWGARFGPLEYTIDTP